MGLGFAAGAALAARLRSRDRRAFALLSDGECNEGSIWEAAQFAGHHQLANLTVLIDSNRQQAFGYTRDILRSDRLAEQWESFGWDVQRVNGHDLRALQDVLARLDHASGRPHALIADTVCGKGVSFMESQIKWHYLPMNDDQYRRALSEVEGRA
jgi:transketolase